MFHSLSYRSFKQATIINMSYSPTFTVQSILGCRMMVSKIKHLSTSSRLIPTVYLFLRSSTFTKPCPRPKKHIRTAHSPWRSPFRTNIRRVQPCLKTAPALTLSKIHNSRDLHASQTFRICSMTDAWSWCRRGFKIRYNKCLCKLFWTHNTAMHLEGRRPLSVSKAVSTQHTEHLSTQGEVMRS